MPQTLSFDPFGPQHLDDALRLSREAGWPHRREDWALALQVSKGVVAQEDGAVIATALATPFGPVAMVNMIIVDQRMRGRGLGRTIMERAMALAQPQEWRLVATQAGLPLYEKLGFVADGHVYQHQGPVADLAAPAGVRWADADDIAALTAIDRAATGAERSTLLQVLATQGRIAVLPGKGYAALRPFGRGEVAGPVIADDLQTAQDLLAFLFAGRAGAFMRVDAAGAGAFATWLSQIGLAEIDRGVSMHYGTPAEPGEGFVRFALAAQALG